MAPAKSDTPITSFLAWGVRGGVFLILQPRVTNWKKKGSANEKTRTEQSEVTRRALAWSVKKEVG